MLLVWSLFYAKNTSLDFSFSTVSNQFYAKNISLDFSFSTVILTVKLKTDGRRKLNDDGHMRGWN